MKPTVDGTLFKYFNFFIEDFANNQRPPITMGAAWELFEQGKIRLVMNGDWRGMERTRGGARLKIARRQKKMAERIKAWRPKGIDRTLPEEQIEIRGYQRIDPVHLDDIEGARLIIQPGEDAARIREGLRGSVIEEDIQSLCKLDDGVNLLTGFAPETTAISALEQAGLLPESISLIKKWGADEIAVNFVEDDIILYFVDRVGAGQ